MAIVLTGATGFVGSHLLSELLRQDAPVIALVRQEPELARARLACAVAATGAGPEQLRRLDSVRLVQSDLEQPLLGLEQSSFHDLAREIDTLWHCAAHIDLDAPEQAARRVNVDGTRRILQLAEAAEQPVHLVHMSTAFVAGRRPSGTVSEDDLDGTHGFVNSYEQSKYEAEVLVRDWAAARRTAVTVLRPGVLVTSRPPAPRAPRHPHAVIGARLAVLASRGLERILRRAGLPLPDSGHVTARLAVDPQAAINILPVEYAAPAILRLASAPHPGGVRTHHVVHPNDTLVKACFQAVAGHVPGLDVRTVPQFSDPTPLEQLLEHLSPLASGYRAFGRRYDRSTLDAADAAAGVSPPPALDVDYLARTFATCPPHPTPGAEAAH
ncbi:SDR family oxidoreductase [Streptomyces sp. CA-132043]|uniref:SDR family oxidoreductase n=1 Tax=Streptomyces sp. CA-132043 TaxID=3240048 RepID=UPI003D9161EA